MHVNGGIGSGVLQWICACARVCAGVCVREGGTSLRHVNNAAGHVTPIQWQDTDT